MMPEIILSFIYLDHDLCHESVQSYVTLVFQDLLSYQKMF